VYGFDLHQSQASTHRPSRGLFKCLDFATGKVRWETDTVGQASALFADGKLILWAETGTLILARATPERYDELARTALLGDGGMCWAAPTLSGKRLYLRDHRRVVCVYLGPPADLDPARPLEVVAVGGRGFDWTRLSPREPDFPNDGPTPGDVGRWFGLCLGLFGTAGVVAVLAPRRVRCRAFGAVAFALGAAGTTTIGASADVFVLTWPVSLYVAFRAVVGLGRSATAHRDRVLARLTLLAFVAGCYGYYRLCLAVGYAMAWGYLAGFVVALPFAVTASRVSDRRLRLVADAAGFTAYFWASGLLPGWKAEL
jgi:hypothetical protein